MTDKTRNRITFVVVLIGTILLCFFIGFNAHAAKFNRGEVELLNLAYSIGKSTGFPEYFQSIMLNETVAGRWGRHGDKNFKSWKRQSYGVMQVQFTTARAMYKDMNDKELLLRLRFDDAFNLRTAKKHFMYLLKEFRNDPARAVLAYNVGSYSVHKNGFSRDPNKYHPRSMDWVRKMYVYNVQQGNTASLKYTIVKGDTLFKIAKELIGNGRAWRKILNANKGLVETALRIGDQIVIPIE